jgi:uncharacterized alkaline shock family protein YloU
MSQETGAASPGSSSSATPSGSSSAAVRGSGSSATGGGGAAGGLQTGRGTTTIADAVVSKVAGIAAREVRGVHSMGGGASRALGGMTQRIGFGDERTQGVSVEVGEREAAIDLTIVVEYGESIPQVANQVRENVVRRIEGITGLSVTEVNVTVNDLYFPGEDVEPPPEPPRVQ